MAYLVVVGEQAEASTRLVMGFKAMESGVLGGGEAGKSCECPRGHLGVGWVVGWVGRGLGRGLGGGRAGGGRVKGGWRLVACARWRRRA